MDPNEYKASIDAAFSAYQDSNTSNQSYRQNGKVPYTNHALWAATMILIDVSLPWRVREIGYPTLLFHDVLEDTDAGLPAGMSDEVAPCVREMTFKNFRTSVPLIPKKAPMIKLFILVDKLSTLIEEHIDENDPEKRALWKETVAYLTSETRKNYGATKIVVIAEAMLAASDW